jgi:hypothetical protein
MHAAKGSASGTYRHGGRSKYVGHLFGEMATAYTRAVSDPELLNLGAELALTEARIVDALEQRRLAQPAKASKASKRATAAIDLALTDQLDLKRRLATSQARILRDTHQMLTQGQVLEVIAQLVEIVRRHVQNPSEVTAVVVALSGLLDSGARAPTDAA